jgi:hypothetical protein
MVFFSPLASFQVRAVVKSNWLRRSSINSSRCDAADHGLKSLLGQPGAQRSIDVAQCAWDRRSEREQVSSDPVEELQLIIIKKLSGIANRADHCEPRSDHLIGHRCPLWTRHTSLHSEPSSYRVASVHRVVQDAVTKTGPSWRRGNLTLAEDRISCQSSLRIERAGHLTHLQRETDQGLVLIGNMLVGAGLENEKP